MRTAERLVNLVAILCILSWRIFWMTMVNRSQLKITPHTGFTELELYLLDTLIRDKADVRKRTKSLSAYLIKLACLTKFPLYYMKAEKRKNRKRPAGLSITHKLSTDDRSQFNVGQANQTSPHDLIARWRIMCTSQIAAQEGEFRIGLRIANLTHGEASGFSTSGMAEVLFHTARSRRSVQDRLSLESAELRLGGQHVSLDPLAPRQGLNRPKNQNTDHSETRILTAHPEIREEPNSYGCPNWVPQRYLVDSTKPLRKSILKLGHPQKPHQGLNLEDLQNCQRLKGLVGPSRRF